MLPTRPVDDPLGADGARPAMIRRRHLLKADDVGGVGLDQFAHGVPPQPVEDVVRKDAQRRLPRGIVAPRNVPDRLLTDAWPRRGRFRSASYSGDRHRLASAIMKSIDHGRG
jgi:hypothetical protein